MLSKRLIHERLGENTGARQGSGWHVQGNGRQDGESQWRTALCSGRWETLELKTKVTRNHLRAEEQPGRGLASCTDWPAGGASARRAAQERTASCTARQQGGAPGVQPGEDSRAAQPRQQEAPSLRAAQERTRELHRPDSRRRLARRAAQERTRELHRPDSRRPAVQPGRDSRAAQTGTAGGARRGQPRERAGQKSVLRSRRRGALGR